MSPNILLTKPGKTANGTIQLTGSKSECNRALVIEALSNGKVKVQNVSDAADTVLLHGILNGKSENPEVGKSESDSGNLQLTTDHSPITTVNIGPAGTAMRFLTAYFTLQPEEVILTGSARMKQRPIGILVDALRE